MSPKKSSSLGILDEECCALISLVLLLVLSLLLSLSASSSPPKFALFAGPFGPHDCSSSSFLPLRGPLGLGCPHSFPSSSLSPCSSFLHVGMVYGEDV